MSGISAEGGDSFTINLYPMLDVFSILICFLLMNYSTAGESVDTKANLELPKSDVKMTLDAAANVSITKTELIIQGGITIPIGSDGDVSADVRKQGAIMPAFEEFKKIRAQNETLKNRQKDLNLSNADMNSLTLEADKSIEFKLIKRVMLTAQQADFVSWKLAVDRQSTD